MLLYHNSTPQSNNWSRIQGNFQAAFWKVWMGIEASLGCTVILYKIGPVCPTWLFFIFLKHYESVDWAQIIQLGC